MDNLLQKLIYSINIEIDSINQKISNIDNNIENNIYNNINNFLIKYNKDNEFDFSLLETFIDKLEPNNLLSLNDYKKIISLIESLENNQILTNFLEDAKVIVNSLIDKSIVLSQKILDDINNKKQLLSDELLKKKKILDILEKISNKEYIDDKDFNYIINIVNSGFLDLTKEETKSFIINLVKENAIIMKEKIEEKKGKDVLPTIDVLIANLLTHNQAILYYKAKKLIKNYNITKTEEDVILYLLKPNSSIETRLNIYSEFSNDKNISELIIKDIELNILSEIDKNLVNNIVDDNLFTILEYLLNKIKEIQEKEKFDYKNYLTELNNNDSIDMLTKVENLISKCISASNNDKAINDTLNQYIDNLKNVINNYINSLWEYKNNNNDENKEYMELSYNEVIEEYNKLLDITTELFMTNKGVRKLYFDEALKFYDSLDHINNIIVFVNDDETDISIIESDIENNRRLSNKNQIYRAVIAKINSMIMDSFDVGLGQPRNNKAKSQNYTTSFLKEFGIRGIHVGDARILYSRHSTTLSEVYPNLKDNPHIIVLYEVAYGATDGTKKSSIYELAIKRCYDNSENLRNIISLFKTDWSSLTDSEKKEKKELINNYLIRNQIKLGHLISNLPEFNINKAGGNTLK